MAKKFGHEDFANSDWTTLDPPASKAGLVGHAHDEVEDLGAGTYNSFDMDKFTAFLGSLLNVLDYRIFINKLLLNMQDLMITRFLIH